MKYKIHFLGYIVGRGTIRPSLEKTRAAAEFATPRDKKALQRFLGLTSYFEKPFSDLLRKNASFKWASEQYRAFGELKEALTGSPVLKLYDQNTYTEIHTDASKDGRTQAVLLQRDKDDEQPRPVQYMSRNTTLAEERYHSYELEVLAKVQALKTWRVYVLGKRLKSSLIAMLLQ